MATTPPAATSRAGALSGLAGIVLLDVGWFWDPAAPQDMSDKQLAAWYSSHGNGPWLAAAALITLAAPFFWIFAGHVAQRLAVTGGSERAQKLVGRAGRAFAVVVGVFGPVYAAIPLGRVLTQAGDPSGPVSRFVEAMQFSEYVAFTTVTAVVFTLAVCITGWSTRAVPRWLTVVGCFLSLVMLASPVLPMEGITLWFLIASITLAIARPRAVARPASARDGVAVPA